MRYLYILIKSLPKPSLLQTGCIWDPDRSQFSHSLLTGKMFQSINHICALHWTCFNKSMAFLQWVAQNWTQCFRCDLPSAEERGDITPNDLLLFLTQPGILLDFFLSRAYSWFIFNFLFTLIPWSSSAKLFCSHLALSLYCCMGLFLYISCIKLHALPISPVCQNPSEWQCSHLVNQSLLQVLYLLQIC